MGGPTTISTLMRTEELKPEAVPAARTPATAPVIEKPTTTADVIQGSGRTQMTLDENGQVIDQSGGKKKKN
jgi:hypothetical protein